MRFPREGTGLLGRLSRGVALGAFLNSGLKLRVEVLRARTTSERSGAGARMGREASLGVADLTALAQAGRLSRRR